MFPRIPLRQVLDFLMTSTQPSGSMKKKEVRDVLFGRIFGFLAIERSGRLSISSESTNEVKDSEDSNVIIKYSKELTKKNEMSNMTGCFTSVMVKHLIRSS